MRILIITTNPSAPYTLASHTPSNSFERVATIEEAFELLKDELEKKPIADRFRLVIIGPTTRWNQTSNPVDPHVYLSIIRTLGFQSVIVENEHDSRSLGEALFKTEKHSASAA